MVVGLLDLSQTTKTRWFVFVSFWLSGGESHSSLMDVQLTTWISSRMRHLPLASRLIWWKYKSSFGIITSNLLSWRLKEGNDLNYRVIQGIQSSLDSDWLAPGRLCSSIAAVGETLLNFLILSAQNCFWLGQVFYLMSTYYHHPWSKLLNFVRKEDYPDLSSLPQVDELDRISGVISIQLPILHRDLRWRPTFDSQQHQTHPWRPPNQRRRCSLAFSTGNCLPKPQHYAVRFIQSWGCHGLLDHVVNKSYPLRPTERCGEKSNGASHYSSSHSCQDAVQQAWLQSFRQLKRRSYELPPRHWRVIPRNSCCFPNSRHDSLPSFSLHR